MGSLTIKGDTTEQLIWLGCTGDVKLWVKYVCSKNVRFSGLNGKCGKI